MDNWVDFKAVKEAISMQMALDHYAINWLRKSGKELRGRCPIHKGEGKDTFHVNLGKAAFQCFSCHARGNVLDFVAAMENCTVRDAALKLKDWFQVASGNGTERPERKSAPAPRPAKRAIGESGGDNKPLTFQLKGIDCTHPYLASRGISTETAERFGVGYYAGKGSMSGRIVIPIHNPKGELVAYAGRAIDDDTEAKYKFPAGFHKGSELFNFHRVLKEAAAAQPIVLVEGFFDCMKVDQAGFPALAVMGSSLSDAQEQLITEFERVLILFDGDDAGRAGAEEISNRLKHRLFVRVMDLPDGKQPDQLSPEELRELLAAVM